MSFLSVKNILKISVSLLMLTSVSCSSANNTASKESDMSLQSEKQQDGQQGDTVITMAVGNNVNEILKDEIESFNSADNGYRIVTKCYDKEFYDENGLPIDTGMTDEDMLSIDFNLIQDIINTDDIDIIASNAFGNEAKYEILKNKGAFTDLYPFMENDKEVNISTLNQHILSLNEIEGKLYSIPVFFSATTLMGEEKYVGNKENWTVEEFISHWEEMPDGSTVNGSMNSEETYYDILRTNLESFIDYEKTEVHFNYPEFRQILEFCSRFPSNNGEKGEYDFESPRLVTECNLCGIMSAGLFSKNPEGISYTMVGFPSSNGKGAFLSDTSGIGRYSISVKSSPEKQKGAWEFIRTFYTEEYQMNHVIEKYVYNNNGEEIIQFSSEFGFCINNNAFKKHAQKIMNKEYYDGKGVDKGEEYTYEMPVQEEVDKLVEYLDSVDSWEVCLDSSLWHIINDEVMAYFAGEKSLDEAVEIIQNRALIWLSEQC